jgi:filamentous hemagglutinin family protein
MNTRFWYGHCLKIGIVLAATSGYLCSQKAIAQIVPDRTLGVESSVVTPNVDIKGLPSDRIDAGAIRGANLFHSFQEFNIRDGRGAYFSNPTGIENIFSRVTGTNASNIFGKLGVLGNANLFLLNPNGIIFGPNASLDIAGSFSASTGNSFNFGDAKFSATNPTDAPLLSVKVPLGVQFNQNQPSAIANSGNLSVGTGQNLNLIGGTVVSTGQLSAPGGQIAVASVPGGSVVNLSPSAQFLNVETSSPVASVGLSSLSELLTSVDERSRPGLTVNSNGQVELTGSGLPVVDGDVVARNVTAQTATLTANNNLTLVESQLGTTGDLNLLAGDTVRVRDSLANPFVAQAGGKLLVQGREGVDIFALNNSSSGLVSGGDLVLRSLNTVGGDAHYWAGGNFRIEKLDGSLGGLFSPYDPIIRASGDVSFASYTGASLHILAGGSVTIDGTVTITGADGTNGLVETVLLSDDDPNGDRSFVDIDGGNFPTLDIRAGTTAFGTVGLTPNPIPGIVPPNFSVDPTSVPTSANITIGGTVFNSSGQATNTGQVLLTNQYNRNSLRGSIQTGAIITFGDVTIDSRGDITTNARTFNGENISIDTSIDGDTISNRISGDIRLISNGNINIGGDLLSRIRQVGERTDGLAGDITLNARGDITVRNSNNPVNIIALSNNNDIDSFSEIILESTEGSVFLDRVQLSTTNTGSAFAGDIKIDAAKNVEIIGLGNTSESDKTILTDGYFGKILINAGDNLSIKDSILTAQALSSLPEPRNKDKPQAGNIELTSRNGKIDINNSSFFASTSSQFASAGNITLKALDAISINDSDIRSRVLQDAIGRGRVLDVGSINIFTDKLTVENGSNITVDSPDGEAGNLNFYANRIFLDDGKLVATAGSPGEGANINLQGLGSNSPLKFLLMRNESKIEANARNSASGGNININTQLLIALPPTGANGSGNDITANALDKGDGGRINITSSDRLGVYGIQRQPQQTRFNDITASSQLGQQGTVSISRPDVDPERGLLQLPEDLGDSSRLITQSCPVGRTQAASRFTVTGRGGLPPSPSSALSSDVLMGNTTTNVSPRETRSIQSTSPSSTLVEAKGMNIGPKGEIIFTANPSKSSSDNSWQRNTDCNAK